MRQFNFLSVFLLLAAFSDVQASALGRQARHRKLAPPPKVVSQNFEWNDANQVQIVDQIELDETLTLGLEHTIFFQLTTPSPLSKKIPGQFQMTDYDPEYLVIQKVGWFPFEGSPESNPALGVRVKPSQIGTTDVKGWVQLDRENSLFVHVIYHFHIVSG